MAHGYPDFEGDKSGLYLKPEWASKEGTDKNFDVTGLNKTWGQSASVSYTVPADKTLYITGYSFNARPGSDPAAIVQVLAHGYIFNNTTSAYYGRLGGEGGASITFPVPIVIEGSEQVTFYVIAFGSVALVLGLTAWGYEV